MAFSRRYVIGAAAAAMVAGVLALPVQASARSDAAAIAFYRWANGSYTLRYDSRAMPMPVSVQLLPEPDLRLRLVSSVPMTVDGHLPCAQPDSRTLVCDRPVIAYGDFRLGAGNDVFDSRAWLNLDVDGGAGDDDLLGGSGIERMTGGPGRDYLEGAGDDDGPLDGGEGADYVNGGQGNDILVEGCGGEDILVGGPGDNRVIRGLCT